MNPYQQEWDEPPTHLPADDGREPNVVVGEIAPPLYLDEDDQRSINGAIINRHSVVSRHSVSRSAPSASAPTPIRTRPKATPAPELRSEAPTPASKHKKGSESPSMVHVAKPAQPAKPAPAPAPKAASKSVHASPAPAPGPKPQPAPPPQQQVQGPPPGPMPQLPGVDPLMIPTPPELAPTIFSWVRRLALQLDLKSADRMLRDALLDVTSSLSVAIVYPGADELYSLAGDEEVPADPTPLVMVAQARRAMIASHTAIIPIMTTGETVGVILLQRNPRNPGYTPIEQVSMLCLSREVAAIMHNLAVEHVTKQTEVKADAGSLYRGEALEAHRSRGAEGHALQLSPGWVRRTYPILIIGLVVALIFSVFIHVPTYSTGLGIITYPGERVSMKTAGVVGKVYVANSMEVKKGDPLFTLQAANEEQELESSTKQYNQAGWNYLQDQNNEGAAANLNRALTQLVTAKQHLADKTYRAPRDGVIADVHVHSSNPVNPGELGVKITGKDDLPEVWAFMPGGDRPRLANGQDIQIAIPGFNKNREHATVNMVWNEVYNGQELAKQIGPEFADLNRMEGSWALVHGTLKSKYFVSAGKKMFFINGTSIQTEIKTGSKPFLSSLLPALEKYLPE